jgi:flagellin
MRVAGHSKEEYRKMSLRINLNTAALSAHRTLAESDSALGKTIERLSSGFRINSAGDDPAGLVISEKLRAQVSGLGQAIKNAGDAVNMVKTAEGALNEVHRLLRSMRDLAVHAGNTGATDSTAAQADQAQISNAIMSLNKVATETQFGNRKLLDGSAGIRARINGAQVMTGDFSYSSGIPNGSAVSVRIDTAAEKAVLASGATYGANATLSSVATWGATGSVFGAASTIALSSLGTVTSISVAAASTVTQVVDAINAYTTVTGLTATYDATAKTLVVTKSDALKGSSDRFTVDFSGGTAFAAGQTTAAGFSGTFATSAGSFYVNGIRIDFDAGDSVDTIISKMNTKIGTTSARASFNTVTNKIEVKSLTYGSDVKLNMTSATIFLGGGQSACNDVGVDVVGTVTYATGTSLPEAISELQWNKGAGLNLKDSLGNTIVMRESAGSATGDYGVQFDLGVNTLRFQVGAYENQIRDVNIGSIFAEELGRGAVEDENVSTLNVTTYEGAQNAISILDSAIADVSSLRAALGATQANVLESSITSLNIAQENISASESTIRDTDMASEITNLTREQILQQSGVAMLAQANQTPQTLLKLLQ